MDGKPTTKGTMNPGELHERLIGLVDEYIERNLTDHYKGRQDLALGLMASSAFNWDGRAILLMAAEGLEDANFHADAADLRKRAGE